VKVVIEQITVRAERYSLGGGWQETKRAFKFCVSSWMVPQRSL